MVSEIGKTNKKLVINNNNNNNNSNNSDRVAQLDKPFASVSEARVRIPAGVCGKKLGQLFHTTLPL